TIVYYGELGGTDEYELADLISKKKIKKEVICYIAGIVADMFESPPQFGHAKALAKTDVETAVAKKKVLKDAGAKVADSFSEFVEMIGNSNGKVVEDNEEYSIIQQDMTDRKKALIASSISGDIDGEPQILGENLLSFAKDHSFAYISASLFLGRKIQSQRLEKCVDFILRQLVDHGPYVSGAVNTIIASRAGKDLVSSLSAGLLTIGPRFGGAINQAAKNWLTGVLSKKPAFDFVEDFASRKEYISGIGHKKYRVDYPDPRVKEILAYTDELSQKRFTVFAKGVEKITTEKKGNLILNVDGAIAAVLLDILSEDEHTSDEELSTLIDTEFFNAFFVLSRSVGFIAHFLDQKRLDEGLFRLEEDQVALSR
ncbi:MAG: citrate/2-methylcitrate synthase, partial [Patescibacteria group bacterium]